MNELPDNPRAQIGGNQPPDPLTALTEATAPIRARLLAIRVALLKVPETVTDSDTAARISDQIIQAQKELRKLDKVRVAFKKPFDDLADAVQRHCQEIGAIIGTKKTGVLAKVHARHHAYQVALADQLQSDASSERVRIAGLADEAYRQASEMEERADAAARAATTGLARSGAAALADQALSAKQAADRLADKLASLSDEPTAHIRGTASLSYLVDRALGYRVTDESVVPREYLSVNDMKVKAAINAGIEIPGIETIRNRDTVVKG